MTLLHRRCHLLICVNCVVPAHCIEQWVGACVTAVLAAIGLPLLGGSPTDQHARVPFSGVSAPSACVGTVPLNLFFRSFVMKLVIKSHDLKVLNLDKL